MPALISETCAFFCSANQIFGNKNHSDQFQPLNYLISKGKKKLIKTLFRIETKKSKQIQPLGIKFGFIN